MECKKCKYSVYGSCIITNMCNTKSCTLLSDDDVENLHICYNCKHWLGGGDWGLSCRKNYYLSSTNGFREACEEFERKNENETSL